jgi:hypothetical protein
MGAFSVSERNPSLFPGTGLNDTQSPASNKAGSQSIEPMYRNRPLASALAAFIAAPALLAQYATAVVEFNPGASPAAGLTNSAAAIGEPSRSTPGQFGGPVEPFSPPYTGDQLVSIGTGGSLTVRFASPIRNDPLNPYGSDFSIFGSAGFQVTNAFDENFNYIGTPATDGSLFNPNTGTTKVSVSADGTIWYALDPSLAPVVDHYFPTDGSGNFSIPVSPSLRPVDMSGRTLEQIRAAYAGSAGGAAYDIAWARDGAGLPVSLEQISFIRVDVLTGRAEIDGFAAVSAVPEPRTIALVAIAGAGALVFRRRTQNHR